MKYELFRLEFQTGVHFGNHNLDESESGFCADTLFSALFHEALKMGDERKETLIAEVKAGKLLFSDGFPYIGDTCYLPKPMIKINDRKQESVGDSVIKKAYKKLNYIPLNKMKSYIDGNFDPVAEVDKIKKLGKNVLKTSASIKQGADTEPYHVGIYRFSDSGGLYVIGCFATDEDEGLFKALLTAVGYAGIGGKRTAGLGKFLIRDIRSIDTEPFRAEGKNGYLLLSVALPRDYEMESAMEDARVTIRKRSGFIASSTYAETYRKKKDLYIMQAGGVVKNKFAGDVYDVSDGGAHPVYRYAKPLFWAL